MILTERSPLLTIECPICMVDKSKYRFKACDKCINRVCNDCYLHLEKCPYCRAPFDKQRKLCKKIVIGAVSLFFCFALIAFFEHYIPRTSA